MIAQLAYEDVPAAVGIYASDHDRATTMVIDRVGSRVRIEFADLYPGGGQGLRLPPAGALGPVSIRDAVRAELEDLEAKGRLPLRVVLELAVATETGLHLQALADRFPTVKFLIWSAPATQAQPTLVKFHEDIAEHLKKTAPPLEDEAA